MKQKHNNPLQTILFGFLFFIVLGSVVLYMPFSYQGHLTYIDALFTSTSAVCVTGLTVVSMNHFTLIGQLIILLLIQIGGLGYMASTSFLLLSFKKNFSYADKLILKESLNYPSMHNILDFLKRVILFVFICEFLGSIILSVVFSHYYGLEKGIYYGIFHSISAFNNAGFSLFGNSLIGFKNNIIVNITIMSLIVVGGIGFIVVDELILYKQKFIKRLSIHVKLVLLITIVLIFFGALLFFTIEYNNTLGNEGFFSKMLISLFQSITTRTAGFNSIDLTHMHNTTIFLCTMLMAIGASPGGTGGGIKTTTAGVIILFLYSYIKGEENTNIFGRRISDNIIKKSLVIMSLSTILITISAFVISDIENMNFLDILFEVVSALSTVGLSISNHLSLSSVFTDTSKIIIIMLMFIGRIGIFSFAAAIFKKRRVKKYKVPEGRVLV